MWLYNFIQENSFPTIENQKCIVKTKTLYSNNSKVYSKNSRCMVKTHCFFFTSLKQRLKRIDCPTYIMVTTHWFTFTSLIQRWKRLDCITYIIGFPSLSNKTWTLFTMDTFQQGWWFCSLLMCSIHLMLANA